MKRLTRHPRYLIWARVGVSLLWLLVLVALALQWLPFGFILLMLGLSLTLPLCWPRQFGSWPGVLALVLVVWGAAFLAHGSGAAVSTWLANLAYLLLIAALAAWPVSLGLLLWRRDASVAVLLLSAAVLPMLLTLLFAGAGLPLDDQAIEAMSWAGWAGWMTLWYPMLGVCMGSAGFLASLILLIVREFRGEGRSLPQS